MEFLRPEAFFDLTVYQYRDLFANCSYVWNALEEIPSYLERYLTSNVGALDCFRKPLSRTAVLWQDRLWWEGFEFLGGDVTKGTFQLRIKGEETSEAVVLYEGCILWDDQIHLGPGSVVEPGALIKGPVLIGSYTEIRQGAYIRGKCLVGDRCVVGHTTEMKNSVMLNRAQAGHFAYIGDSILGNSTNLGAGTKLANLKIKKDTVRIRIGEEVIDTGLRKLGAIIGDGTEIGCNTVTNPGTLLGKECLVFPVTSVAPGYHESQSTIGSI
jgi:acetyltransferase-like isoleucine patch superfamily enzyme